MTDQLARLAEVLGKSTPREVHAITAATYDALVDVAKAAKEVVIAMDRKKWVPISVLDLDITIDQLDAVIAEALNE